MTQKAALFKGQKKKKSIPPNRHGKVPQTRKGKKFVKPSKVTKEMDVDRDMSVLKRYRGGKGFSVTSYDNTNSRGTCSTPQSRLVISPLSLQQQLVEMPANSPPTQNSSVGSSSAINKRKGVYKSINVNLRTAQGAKTRVKFSDSMSRAIGPEARDFSNYCGLTLRTTVSFRDGGGNWKNIFEKYGQDMILKIKDKFEPADVITEEKFHIAISIILQNAFRNWKINLHSHYKKYETDEDRLADPPRTISFQDWEWLLIYFKSDMFKNKSVRNTINREKQMTKHTCCSRSFAEIEYVTRDHTTGQPTSPDQLWEITHTRKTLDGQVVWADTNSEQIHRRMHELSQQLDQDLESDARITSEEILVTVLGERSGYVRGKSYGAELSKKRNRPQSIDSSVVQSVRVQLQAKFDKKFQEEREKMEAERAKMKEEHEKMQEEHEQFKQRLIEQMEQRIQAQFAVLMQRWQPHASTSTPSIDHFI